MHQREARKPTNSGRLAHLCLPNSEVRLRGEIGRVLSLDGLIQNERQTLILYPSEESMELSNEYLLHIEKPITLIVPDGTWTQGSRTARRICQSLTIPHVKLPLGAPSNYRLRKEHDPQGMSTFEAISRALQIIEKNDIEKRMQPIFQTMVERMLYSRGKISAAEVFGGIPKSYTK